MASCGSEDSPRFIAVLGPTACGKTALSLEIARRFGGEIVNCDSRQVYQEMLIGTAVPTPGQMAVCPHHLFAFVSPSDTFSAGTYSLQARDTITRLKRTGTLPVVVGGTGFYFEALTEGLPADSPASHVREGILARLETAGLDALLRELTERDPEAVTLIDTKNPRRVARALEIVTTAGKPLKSAREDREAFEARVLVIKPTLPRPELHSRIARRVMAMVADGLEQEVDGLRTRFGFDAPGLRSIGYQEWEPYFGGTATRDEVIGAIVIHTRQYAKRQETWFRHRVPGPSHDLSLPGSVPEILRTIEAFLTT